MSMERGFDNFDVLPPEEPKIEENKGGEPKNLIQLLTMGVRGVREKLKTARENTSEKVKPKSPEKASVPSNASAFGSWVAAMGTVLVAAKGFDLAAEGLKKAKEFKDTEEGRYNHVERKIKLSNATITLPDSTLWEVGAIEGSNITIPKGSGILTLAAENTTFYVEDGAFIKIMAQGRGVNIIQKEYSTNCASCGAPLRGSKCEYCGSKS